MSADISIYYKGKVIGSISESGEEPIPTKGSWCVDDITIVYDKPSSNLQSKEATPSQEEQIVTADEGFTGLSSVKVNPIPSNYGLITWNGSYLTVS